MCLIGSWSDDGWQRRAKRQRVGHVQGDRLPPGGWRSRYL
jgi:hypothetical protein